MKNQKKIGKKNHFENMRACVLNKIIVPHFIQQGVNIQVRTFMVIWDVESEFPREEYKIRKVFGLKINPPKGNYCLSGIDIPMLIWIFFQTLLPYHLKFIYSVKATKFCEIST